MYILLSYKIDGLSPFYGGKKGFSYDPTSSIEKGDAANTQKWELPNHLGTHIDFPYHFYQNGQTVDDFHEEFWIFNGEKIQILEVNIPENKFLIETKHFEKNNLNFDADFLILRTGIGKYRCEEKFWKYNPGLSLGTANWVKENFKKLRIIGLDSISISSWQHRDVGRKVHKKMLDPEKPILIAEDMDLSKINKGTIFIKVYIAPLMVSKSDGSPCTILAEVE